MCEMCRPDTLALIFSAKGKVITSILHGQIIMYYQLVGKGIKSPTSESLYFTGFPAGH